MATSRTGTGTYRNNRKRLIKQAKRAGIETCPRCGTYLDYVTPLQPNSVEADHIVPHNRGGSDAMSNLQILCRSCNRLLSDKRVKHVTRPKRVNETTAFTW